MKFRTRKTAETRKHRKSHWHRWFAWYPVKVKTHSDGSSDKVWFGYVDRKGEYQSGHDDSWWDWEHRPYETSD